MIKTSTLSFLNALAKNNNKPWFESNREAYTMAKENFQDFVTALINGISKFDADIKPVEMKQAIFRQNRDIRFSNDKRPYKNNFGASLSRGGKKSNFAGYYFHLEPGNKSFAAGGIWMPEAPDLKKIRQEIDYSLADFEKIVKSKPFQKYFGGLEETSEYMLVNIPKGYEKDNPAAKYLKFKSLIATRYLKDEEVLKQGFLKDVITTFSHVTPLIKFINHSLE